MSLLLMFRPKAGVAGPVVFITGRFDPPTPDSGYFDQSTPGGGEFDPPQPGGRIS